MTAPLRVELQEVTPERAAAWLKQKAPNRHLSVVTVNKYARDMIASRWELNGETVKLDQFGRVVDGQHRLEAVVAAGIPVRLLIASGVGPTAMATIDAGRSRTFSDVVRIRGTPNSIALAAAAAWLYRYENAMLPVGANRPISHAELDETLIRHPGLADSVQLAICGTRIVPAPALAFAHYWARRALPEKADTFLHIVQHGVAPDGAGLPSENAALRLRERFISERGSKQKIHRLDALALVIRAWAYYRDGKPVQILRWRNRGPAAEQFPTMEQP